MLAYDDSSHVRKERDNKTRVNLTNQILDSIRDMHPEKLEHEVRAEVNKRFLRLFAVMSVCE